MLNTFCNIFSCYNKRVVIPMSFLSLPTGKLHKIQKQNKKKFPIRYVGRSYRNLTQNVDSAVGQECYSRIVGDTNIPTEDVQKYLLSTSDFGKGMEDDINVYVTRDKLNNVSFRQKLDLIEENIFRRKNPLELVFMKISTFDAQNPVAGSLLKELDLGKKGIGTQAQLTLKYKIDSTH